MGEMTLKTCHKLMIESITFVRDCDAAAGQSKTRDTSRPLGRAPERGVTR